MSISRPITRSTARKIVLRDCRSLRFNGVNNYGQLATRAIDPDGDIDIEWYQSAANTGALMCIVGQSISGGFTLSEFRILILANGNLSLLIGGSAIDAATVAEGFTLEGNYRVTLIGDQLVTRKNGVVIATRTFARGGAREPGAVTLVGAQQNGAGNFFRHFNGLIPYIRINGTYWAMDAVGQAIQPSLPAGNNMTLFNTVPEQWEGIPCNLRP